MSETELSLGQYEQAVKLHNRIMASASLAQQSLWEMCSSLKEISLPESVRAIERKAFEGCSIDEDFSRRMVVSVTIVE